MNGALGKRPRHYALDVLALETAKERREALKHVPDPMRKPTRLHVKLALGDIAIARHVRTIATTRGRLQRVALLDEVPLAIREKVRRRVIRVMRERRR